jgi:FMN-dependent NADH-azoreductase
MANLLYIQASPRPDRSYSIAVAKAFLSSYVLAHPQDNVVTLDLFQADLPVFDGFMLNAKYSILHGKKLSPEEARVWKKVEQIIDEFKSADKHVLATPMWNFGIPYRLKQYIDILVQPTYTFLYTPEKGYEGLVLGKPLMAIYARGGEYSAEAYKPYEMQKSYIELIFSFMGFSDMRSIIIEPTLMGTP